MKEKQAKRGAVYLNLAVSIIAGVFAQLLMKIGMKSASGLTDGNLSSGTSPSIGIYLIVKILLVIFLNKFVLAGIFLYLVSMFFWINVLSKMDLSAAYPFVSLGVILTVVLASFALKENIPLLRWAGIFITLYGVFLVVSSGKDKKDKI